MSDDNRIIRVAFVGNPTAGRQRCLMLLQVQG